MNRKIRTDYVESSRQKRLMMRRRKKESAWENELNVNFWGQAVHAWAKVKRIMWVGREIFFI